MLFNFSIFGAVPYFLFVALLLFENVKILLLLFCCCIPPVWCQLKSRQVAISIEIHSLISVGSVMYTKDFDETPCLLSKMRR